MKQDVNIILFRDDGKIPLLLRHNTGYEDGKYCLPSGHVEPNESITAAAVREASEEIDVDVAEDALSIVHVVNHMDRDRRSYFLTASVWSGTPVNKEKDKAKELIWADPNNLPDNMASFVGQGIHNALNGIEQSTYTHKKTTPIEEIKKNNKLNDEFKQHFMYNIMKYTYSEKDFMNISWNDIDKITQKIACEVKEALSENNLSIKYIAPILRGGGVPAIILSHKLNIIDFLPIQLKCSHRLNKVEEKINLDSVIKEPLKKNECVLLVEGNHVTGRSANLAKDMIIKKFGKDTKIIYVSISKDYSHKDSVADVEFSTCGIYTNETKSLDEKECKKLKIDYRLITLFPWESVEGELKEING